MTLGRWALLGSFATWLSGLAGASLLDGELRQGALLGAGIAGVGGVVVLGLKSLAMKMQPAGQRVLQAGLLVMSAGFLLRLALLGLGALALKTFGGSSLTFALFFLGVFFVQQGLEIGYVLKQQGRLSPAPAQRNE